MWTKEIEAAFAAFCRNGNIISVNQITAGLINATYLVETDAGEKYILQKINTFVFKNPDELMENIVGVTKHLSEKIKAAGGDYKRETLNFLPCNSGEYYFRDENSGAWRMYIYVDDALTYNKPKDGETFRSAGSTFGRFMKLLADYPAETLHETIVNFHYTPARYDNFMKAVEADVKGRRAEVEQEIAFVTDRKADTHRLTDMIAEGVLPLRVTHNDTKLNNVLFDIPTDKSICVIDLDTIMPGLSLYDFGDMVRSATNSAGEDEIDVELALRILYDHIGADCLLLEGGSVVNGYFQRAGAVDELSLVVAPVVADKGDKPLFTDSIDSGYELIKAESINGNVILNYKKK